MATMLMREAAPLTGEQIERAKRRRRMMVLALMALVGLAIGFAAGKLDKATVGQVADWPEAAAIALALLYLGLLASAQWFGNRGADELERHNNTRSMMIGAYGYMAAYPVWYALWRGGFVPEPDHEILFLVFVGSMLAGAIVARFR